MPTRNRILIAIALISLPVLLRVLYFYQAPYSNNDIQKPSYSSFNVPDAPTPSSSLQTVVNPANGKVVVIDNFHGNQFVANEIEPLVTAINAQGANVEFDTGEKTLEVELKYASAYIVFAPSTAFSSNEQRIIRQFVADGGRLLAFSDPTRGLVYYDFSGNPTGSPDVNFLNPIISSFGLTIVNDYLYDLEDNEGNFRNVKFTQFAESPLTKNLNMVVFYGAHSIHAEKGASLVRGDNKTLSSLTDRGGGLTPFALSANGQVLAAGDFSFLTDPFNQVADNQLLLEHLAEFTVAGERNPMLANFPFIFQHPVSLITTGEVELTSDILEPLAGLQKTFKSIDVQINVRKAALKEGDTIVLGTFSPSDDLTPFIKPFNADLQKDETSIDISSVGKVANTNTGVLLFNHGPKSNTLVILAAKLTDLPRLISLVASGDLSTCLVQDNIAVCNLKTPDTSGGFDTFPGDTGTATETPGITPTPGAETATATPSG